MVSIDVCGNHAITFVVAFFQNNVAVSRERLPTSSLDRQRRDIENAAQEIEVRKFLLVQVLGLACDYNENPRIRTY